MTFEEDNKIDEPMYEEPNKQIQLPCHEEDKTPEPVNVYHQPH